MSLKFSGGFGPIAGAFKAGDLPPTSTPHFYLDQFDSSTTGTGTYTNDDRTVSNIPVSTNSKETFRNTQTTDSIRVRWVTTGASYAHHIHLKSDIDGTLASWYDVDNKFRWKKPNGDWESTDVVTAEDSGQVMEIRINTLTGEQEYYKNDILQGTRMGYIPSNISDDFFAYVREGSNSKSTTTLHQDPN
jgi:hypothetical protein